MSGPLSRRCCNPACSAEAPPGWSCDRCDRALCPVCDRRGAGLCRRCLEAPRGQAVAVLRAMVAAIDETDTEAAAGRLLERISIRADADALRSALVEEGAVALVRAARGSR